MRTCESAIRAAIEGDNPYNDRVTVATGEVWKEEADAAGVSAEAYKNAARKRERGLAWLGGECAGGVGQRQIKPNRYATSVPPAGAWLSNCSRPAARSQTCRHLNRRGDRCGSRAMERLKEEIDLMLYDNTALNQLITAYGELISEEDETPSPQRKVLKQVVAPYKRLIFSRQKLNVKTFIYWLSFSR